MLFCSQMQPVVPVEKDVLSPKSREIAKFFQPCCEEQPSEPRVKSLNFASKLGRSFVVSRSLEAGFTLPPHSAAAKFGTALPWSLLSVSAGAAVVDRRQTAPRVRLTQQPRLLFLALGAERRSPESIHWRCPLLTA